MDKKTAQDYILERMQPAMVRLATDPSLFPDQKKALEAFLALDMFKIVDAMDE